MITAPIVPTTAILFPFITVSPQLESKKSSKCSSLAGQRNDHTSQAINDPRHPVEIHFVGGVECGVIVRIPKWSRIRDHDSRPAFLPERPVIGPSNARPVCRSRNSF